MITHWLAYHIWHILILQGTLFLEHRRDIFWPLLVLLADLIKNQMHRFLDINYNHGVALFAVENLTA